MTIVGLDLAGVESRPTGFCVLTDFRAKTSLIHLNKDILEQILRIKPEIIAIDAPLSLPLGRKSLEERNSEHLRESDKELLRRRIKFFPLTLGPMRKLTMRGMLLKEILEKRGFKVIEVYPGGAQDVLCIPRKQRGLDKLRVGLGSLGITGLKDGLSDHELDAVTCAFVGKLHLENRSVTYGVPERGIVMPKDRTVWEIG
jgi:predicted nuclease with RNAse H fold